MMTDAQEIKKKLFDLPEMFLFHYYRKEYAQAKRIHDTAEVVARFLELNEREKIELFGIVDDPQNPDAAQNAQSNFYRPYVSKAEERCLFSSYCCRRAAECDRKHKERDTVKLGWDREIWSS